MGLAGGVSPKEQAVSGVGLVGRSLTGLDRGWLERRECNTYDSLSGNHWHVKLGQSRACVMTRSYRYGAFFFL